MLAILICFAPVVLAAASAGLGGKHRSLWLALPLAFAAAVAVLNFDLSFVRPRAHLRRHGTMDDYRWVSGLPLIGSFIVTLVLITAFGVRWIAVFSLAILTIDTGGLPWLLFMIWKDTTAWERRGPH